jgi:hypothetical protein
VSWLSEVTVKSVPAPLKRTAVARPKALPAIWTIVPGAPLAGVKPPMLGATTPALVGAGFAVAPSPAAGADVFAGAGIAGAGGGVVVVAVVTAVPESSGTGTGTGRATG